MIGTLTTDTLTSWPAARPRARQLLRTPVSNTPRLPPENETSFQLLERARSGDEEARERLCVLYLPRLHRWAKGRIPPAARGPLDTGDVVQEVLMHVLARLTLFEPRDAWSFQAYLRRTLLNRLCDLARRAKRYPAAGALDTSSPALDQSPFDIVVNVEDRERYEAAVKRLRPIDQRAVVARCEWDMSYGEVAQLLGKNTENAARVAIHRALVRLAKEMANGRRQS
jgi:RNA polymerase sigma-70 factor (ECF subfamily)